MSQDFKPLTPKIVLAVGAHPDDIDVTASGSLAKYAKLGAKVYYQILTDGSIGTSDRGKASRKLIEERREEQSQAARIIGAEKPIFSDFKDCSLEVSMEVKKAIVRVIRQVKPDLVICMDLTNYYSLERGMINHSDHRAAGEATLDAVYPLARDHLAFPDLIDEGLEVQKVTTVLLTSFDNCNYYEDISDFIDTKIEAIKAHTSQFGDATTLSSNIKKWNSENGRKANCEYAEAFKRIDMAF